MNKRQVKKQVKKIMKFVELAMDSGVNIHKACKTQLQGLVYECSSFGRMYKCNYGETELKAFREIQKNIIDIMLNDINNIIKERIEQEKNK